MPSLITFTLFIFIVYVIYKIEFEPRPFIQKIKDKRRDKKIRELEKENLSDRHPYFWMWKANDILIVRHKNFTGRVLLKTFSKNFVIAIDENNNQQVTVYARQIESNITNEHRLKLSEARNYQQYVLPDLVESNRRDLSHLLTDNNEKNNEKDI